MAKKQDENLKVYEDPTAIVDSYNKFEKWVAKNKSKLGVLVGILVLGAGALFYWIYTGNETESESYEKIFPAQYEFSRDSMNTAMSGDLTGTSLGFQKISSKYEGTPAGNLSNFYVGTIELRKGNYPQALAALKKFESEDALLQGRAYAMMGDCHMELGQVAEAQKKYSDAVNYKPNDYFTPQYIFKLAMSYEVGGDWAAAVLEYKKIIDQYPNSPAYLLNDAKKYMAIAEGKAGTMK